MQRLDDLVHEAVHSNAPAPPHLVISPAWLTGAGNNALEVWTALQILGQYCLGPELVPSAYCLVSAQPHLAVVQVPCRCRPVASWKSTSD